MITKYSKLCGLKLAWFDRGLSCSKDFVHTACSAFVCFNIKSGKSCFVIPLCPKEAVNPYPGLTVNR